MLAERARSVALLACIAAAHSLLGADLGGGRLPRPLSARRRLLRLLPLRAAAEDASRPASAAAAEDADALAAPTGAASPADSHGNASVAELWCATDARGREWCAVGTNRSRAAEWLAHELGAPVELAGVAECAPLAARRTHRRLRRAWRGGRLLLCGSSLGELLEEGAGASPERSFRRSLGGLAVRARRMSPARHEAAALRGYLERHFLPSHPALSLSDLSPAAAAADPARSEEGVRAMLRWFKEAFPYERGTCASCGASAGYRGTVRASRRERGRLAARAELWRCGECSSWQRFARYNSVPQILRDRRGRCGEYTNAMLQLVLALGWRARWVVDWTDHQWLEIWMPAGGEAGGAWVPLDPCEAAYDEPLLYSAGWGKNMTYVVALGDGALTDVTARYTADYNATLRDRPLSEAQVASALRWVAHSKGAPRLQPAPLR